MGSSEDFTEKGPTAILRSIFEGMDRDGSGKIDVAELNNSLRSSTEVQQLFGVKYSGQAKGKGKGTAPPLPSFFEQQISKLDLDGDGKISFDEFKAYFFPKIESQGGAIASWAMLWKVFNGIDVDHNWQVSAAELRKALSESAEVKELFRPDTAGRTGKGTSQATICENLFAKVDKDGNGTISWKEFSEHFTKS